MPPQGGGAPPGFAAVVEGLRWARKHRVIAMVFLVDLNAMIFGMPRAVFPRIGGHPLRWRCAHGRRSLRGTSYRRARRRCVLGPAGSRSPPGACGAHLDSCVGRVDRGLQRESFAAARATLLAVAGGADTVSAVFRGTMLLQNVPDALLGRLSAVNIVVVTGGPRVGDIEAGSVAALTSPVFSAVSGGLACVVGVIVLGLAVPAFARYRSAPQRDPECTAHFRAQRVSTRRPARRCVTPDGCRVMPWAGWSPFWLIACARWPMERHAIQT